MCHADEFKWERNRVKNCSVHGSCNVVFLQERGEYYDEANVIYQHVSRLHDWNFGNKTKYQKMCRTSHNIIIIGLKILYILTQNYCDWCRDNLGCDSECSHLLVPRLIPRSVRTSFTISLYTRTLQLITSSYRHEQNTQTLMQIENAYTLEGSNLLSMLTLMTKHCRSVGVHTCRYR